jgi:UDP-glucose 4-epimerase
VSGSSTATKVLVAGGAGYIGSTISSACLDAGITPVIIDNLATGRPEFVRGRLFYEGDIADGRLLDAVFAEHSDISIAIHAAALIVVPDSVTDPLRYYRENGCTRYVFSSSAAIYRPGPDLAVDESSAIDPDSPYGRTKWMMECILADSAPAYGLRALSLRYFNPIGADPKLRSGPRLSNAAHVLGRLIAAANSGEEFVVTGTDWPTRDGTGIRDYVHVWDIARAHVNAVQRFDRILPPHEKRRHTAINLGTGNGTTVRELLTAFERVLGRDLPTRNGPRRPGDVAGQYARIDRATAQLNWTPTYSLHQAIQDAIRWSASQR